MWASVWKLVSILSAYPTPVPSNTHMTPFLNGTRCGSFCDTCGSLIPYVMAVPADGRKSCRKVNPQTSLITSGACLLCVLYWFLIKNGYKTHHNKSIKKLWPEMERETATVAFNMLADSGMLSNPMILDISTNTSSYGSTRISPHCGEPSKVLGPEYMRPDAIINKR